MVYPILIVDGFQIVSLVIICRAIGCVQNNQKSARIIKKVNRKQRSRQVFSLSPTLF
jgi:hypothetical protein